MSPEEMLPERFVHINEGVPFIYAAKKPPSPSELRKGDNDLTSLVLFISNGLPSIEQRM